jgi:hypothetical protein
MRQIGQVFFFALVVLSWVGGASAEMTNVTKDNARETNPSSTEAQEREVGTGAGENNSIHSQGATKRDPVGINQDRESTHQESVGTNQNRTGTQQEPVGIVDQLKEGAKGEVDLRGKELNDRIDRFGQQ